MTQSLLFEGVTGFATLHPVFTLLPLAAAVVAVRWALKRSHHEPQPARARVRKP
jgi:hypothetical protein